jgi:hypothetical protein
LKSRELGKRAKKNSKIIFGKGIKSILPLHSQTTRNRDWNCGKGNKVHKNKYFFFL